MIHLADALRIRQKMEQEIRVFGTETCHDTQRSRRHLDQQGVKYEFVDIDEDDEAEQQVIEWGQGKRKIPVIEISSNGRTRRITEPSNAELDRELSQEAA